MWRPESISEWFWHPPPKSANHLNLQGRSRNEAVYSDHLGQLTVFRGVEIFIEPPRFLWCGCLCILKTPQHLGYFSLISSCHLLTTWQFGAVFALANFVAWSPLKVRRNTNSLYRNPTLHKSFKVVMARQSSLQVTSPELTFFLLLSLSGPQTILTVFGHWIWLHNGSMKSTVFRSAIERTPETLNIDQIHANAI